MFYGDFRCICGFQTTAECTLIGHQTHCKENQKYEDDLDAFDRREK